MKRLKLRKLIKKRILRETEKELGEHTAMDFICSDCLRKLNSAESSVRMKGNSRI
jgi:hypothetical protein